jgi:PAS domain S-box-containing protein
VAGKRARKPRIPRAVGARRAAAPARRQQKTLRETSQQFRLAQEALGVVTWVWDLKQDRVQWYGNIEPHLGLARGSFSGRFQDYLRYVHPEDRARAKAVYLDCLKGRTPDYNSEDRVLWPDGSVHWLETYGRASYGPDGRAVRMTGVIKNITPRKRQEAALALAEREYQALFEVNPESVVISRARDGVVINVNAAFEANNGFTREQVIGKSGRQIGAWRNAAQRQALIERLLAGDSVRNEEVELVRADGAARQVLMSATRLEIDGETCFMWSSRDVTDLRKAERRTQQSERKYAALFESSPDAVIITRLSDAVILNVNAAWERYSGFRREQALCRSAIELRSWIEPKDRASVIARLEAEGSIANFETRFRRADGRQIDALLSAARIEIEGEACAIWSWRDVSELREVERAAQQSERKYSALFEMNPEPVLISRIRDGVVLEVNAAFVKNSGFRREQVVGRAVADLGMWSDPKTRPILVERLRADGALRDFEMVLSRADGTLREVLMSATRIELDGEACIIWTSHDVGELRKAERRERQSLEKFATLFKTNPVGIVLAKVGEDETMVELNDAALMVLGVTREEAIGATASSLVKWLQPEQRERVRARVAAGEQLFDQALDFERRDGTRVEALFSAGMIKIDGVPHLLVSIRDVTEQRRIERDHQVADARYRAVFESTSDTIAIHSRDWRYIDVNPAACQLMGYARGELLGQHPSLVLGPEELKRNPLGSGALGAVLERAVTRKDGSKRTVEVVSGPLPDGNIFTVARDITERKRSEKLLMNVARGVSAQVGDKFFYSLVERLAQELGADFAYIAELAGPDEQHMRTLAFVVDGAPAPNAEYPVTGSMSAYALAARRTVTIPKDVAVRFPGTELRKRGVQAYVGTPLYGADGRALGVLTVAHRKPIEQGALWASMTEIFGARAAAEIERARADALVRELNVSLEQRVRERTEELEEANRDLDSYNFSVSHDLRQPLNAIAGFSELLRDSLAGAAGETLEYTHEIEINTTRMERMIEALLGFSRAGRGALQRSQVDMRALVDSVLRDLTAAAPLRARITIGDLPPAEGDATLLRQVWSNLIGNALKYSARAERPSVEISGALRDGGVEYHVRDNGIGFDMRHAERLFGVFQRLPSSAGFEGTGVGLAIVQRIVRRHGGQISGESAPGQGATIRFSLPA